MAITKTTLSAVVTPSDTVINVASATGFTALTTCCQIGDEQMNVQAVNGTVISVQRGAFGTRVSSHGNGTAVLVGAPADLTYEDASGQQPILGPWGFQWSRQFSSGLFYPTVPVVTINTAADATYTAGQVLAGLILDDPNGGARTRTMPTAALLVQAMAGAQYYSAFQFSLRNTADASETITVAAGTGGTTSGTMTVAQNAGKDFIVVFTDTRPGNEAYTIYSLGAYTF
jgi:hypothetical protein